MAGPPFAVKLEGVRRLTRQLALVDPALRKELGRRNKEIGQRVIDAASPQPLNVGQGAGATPRPSANANVLQIVAGGSWRDDVPQDQWGSRWSPRDEDRPYIARAGEQQMPDIEREYLDALAMVCRSAGFYFVRK